MKGWTTKFLEQIAQIGDGNHSGNYPKVGEMVLEGVPFIRGTNLIKGKVSSNNIRFISAEKHKILKKGHLKTGDILFTNRGQIGEKAIVDERFNGSNLNSQLAWFRCDEQINNRYLFYFLESPAILKFIDSNTNGTALQQLTIRQIRKLEIVFPTIEEQKQIVAILDKAFTSIDQAKANIDKNIVNAKELFQSKLNDIFSQKGGGTKEKSLGEVCSLYQGLAINKKTKHLLVEKSSLPLLRIKDLRRNTHEQYVAETGYPINALVREDEIIYTRTGNSLGLVFRGRKGVLHNNSFKVIPNDSLSNNYLFWWLQHNAFTSKIFTLASKAAQPDISHKLFKEQVILVPTLKNQVDYHKVIEVLNKSINKLIDNYTKKSNDLEDLKKSILQKAFAGELTQKEVAV
jgi:type I restriction enzyme S subunit